MAFGSAVQTLPRFPAGVGTILLKGSRSGPLRLSQTLRTPDRVAARRHGSRAIVAAATDPATHTGLLELREYTIKADNLKEFIMRTAGAIETRKKLLPFVGMFTYDTGNALVKIVHLYHYNDLNHRDQAKAGLGASKEWNEGYNVFIVPFLVTPESTIYKPAKGVMGAAGAVPVQGFVAPPKQPGQVPSYEVRKYQIKGVDEASRLLPVFEKAIPKRVEADKNGVLVFVGTTEIGQVNNIIEIWRYPSAQACLEARESAAKVPAWRDATVAMNPQVSNLSTSLMNPLPFSPML